MRQLKKDFGFLAFAILFGQIAFAGINKSTTGNVQTTQSYQIISTKEGLAQIQLENIFKDSRGFMYFMTKNGISRYDGKTIKNFTHPDYFIPVLQAIELNLKIYFRTPTQLLILDRDSLRIVNMKDKFKDIVLYYFDFYHFDKNTIYFKVSSQNKTYLYQYNVVQETVKKISDISPIEDIIHCRGKEMWTMETRQDKDSLLIHYYLNDKRIRTQKFSPIYYKISVGWNKQTHFYRSSKNEGIYRDSIDVKGFIHFVAEMTPFPVQKDIRLFESNKKRIIENGGKNYYFNGMQWIELAKLPTMSSFYVNEQQTAFIGTEQGVYISNNFAFQEIKLGLTNQYDDIWSMLKTKNGEYIYASYFNGFYISRDHNKTYSKLLLNENMQRGGFGILENKAGMVWLPNCFSKSLNFLSQGKLISYPLDRTYEEYFTSILAENGLDMYLGAHRTIFFYSHKTKSVRKIIAMDTIIDGGNVFCFAPRDKHSIFMASSKKIYEVYDQGQLKLFKDKIQFCGSICRDNFGGLWYNSASRLNLISPKDKREKTLIELKSKSNIMSLIQFDHWLVIGTYSELIFFDLKTFYETGKEVYKRLSNRDALNMLEGGQNNFFISEDSLLFYPCSDKIIRIDPRMILQENRPIPPPQIHTIQWYNTDTAFALKSFQKTVTYAVPASMRNIEIRFSSPVFVNHESIQYRYRASAKDEWKYIGNEEVLRLSGMHFGTVQIEMQASMDKVNWSTSEFSPIIKLKAYWYELIWIWILISGILLYVFYKAHRFYMIQKQKKQIEDLSSQIEKQQMQIQIFQSKYLPHFTFNALTNIRYLLKIKEFPKAMMYLENIADLQRTVLEYAEKREITIEKELEFISNYLSIEQLRYQNKLNYQIQISEELNRQIAIPTFCIHTLVENAIKHGLNHKVEDHWQLEILIQSRASHITIEVVDNGIGREKAKSYREHSTGTGLRLLQTQFKSLSECNKKTYSLDYYDVLDYEGVIRGTKAIIQIKL